MFHLILGMSDPAAPWVSGTLAGTAIAVIGVLTQRFLSRYDKQAAALLTPAYDRVKALEKELGHERYKVELCRRLLRRNNIDVPKEVLE